MSSFIERMEAEIHEVNPRAAAFVRRLHTAHGPTHEVMALFSAVLSGDADEALTDEGSLLKLRVEHALQPILIFTRRRKKER